MNATKRKKLEAAGWAVGTAAEFLGLDEAEAAIVEMKLSMASRLKTLRKKRSFTQGNLAEYIHSSQSRIAKLEAADKSASLDLYVRALVALGETPAQIGKVIAVKVKGAPAKSARKLASKPRTKKMAKSRA